VTTFDTHLFGHGRVHGLVHLFFGSTLQQFVVQLETPEHRVGAGVRGAYERRVADGPVPVQPLAAVGHHVGVRG